MAIHTAPSAICCTPKNSGMAAKIICDGLWTFRIVAAPTAESITPPTKLASAEKHMFYFRPPSKNGFNYWEMLTLMVKHWLQINKIAITQRRPFAYKVTAKGNLEELE